MVMIEFTLLVSSSDLTFHHGRQGKRPTITPSKLSSLSEDVKHNWLITIKKSLYQDPIPTVTRVLENMTTKGDHQSGSLRNTKNGFMKE